MNKNGMREKLIKAKTKFIDSCCALLTLIVFGAAAVAASDAESLLALAGDSGSANRVQYRYRLQWPLIAAMKWKC